MQMVMIYTACATLEECKTITHALLEKQVAACVNILSPITAVYPWKGSIAEAAEYPMLIKTFENQRDQAVRIIKKLHTYEVPGIICWDATSLDSHYSQWMQENVQSIS
jgi:periplasmic divalent cation tolerance protein